MTEMPDGVPLGDEDPGMPAEPTRAYDLEFDRSYVLYVPPEPPPPPPPPPPPIVQVPVIWHGLDINPGNMDGDVTAIVELVEGWYGTPEFNGREAERSLTDGAAWGHKTIAEREVAITGACAGPRAPLVSWRDELARRASLREPQQLQITDPWIGRTLTAMVRAGTDSFRHTFIAGKEAFRWQVTLTAADPLLYELEWRQVTLSTVTAADAGRTYPRFYTEHEETEGISGWRYGDPYPEGSSAYLTNEGNEPTPVWAVYAGDLAESRLTDGETSILLNPVAPGEEILVDTGHVTAQAEGGQARASFIRPGSRPIFIPANATSRWHLYSQGSGSVTLGWRSAWL